MDKEEAKRKLSFHSSRNEDIETRYGREDLYGR